MDLNKLAQEIYAQNKAVGWWDDPDRCLYTCLQLVSTEIAEATEGERKNLMDDHLPHRRMGEVELADALIRMLDLGGHLGLTYDDVDMEGSDGYSNFFSKDSTIGKQHAGLNLLTSMMVMDIALGSLNLPESYSMIIGAIFKCAELNGYDIEGAMLEKLEYNKTRADHKRENRQQTNGKKF